MNHSKSAIVTSEIIEKIQLVLGIALAVFWGIMLIVCIVDWEPIVFTFSGIFIAIGALLIVCSRKTKRLLTQYKKYAPLISSGEANSIEDLAAAVDAAQSVVIRDLELMIKRKYLVDVSINKKTNAIVIGSRQVIQPAGNTINIQRNTSVECRTVTCKNCGGVNRVAKGQGAECEYCGSPISVDSSFR